MNQSENFELAVKLCRALYIRFGGSVYPALTGGTLYKNGCRKDIDIVLYPKLQEETPDELFIINSLKSIFDLPIIVDNFVLIPKYKTKHINFCMKAELSGLGKNIPVDLLFMRPVKGDYDRTDTDIIECGLF
jgi:hypothetical protein